MFAVIIFFRWLRLPEPLRALLMMVGFDLCLWLRMLRESWDWFRAAMTPIFGTCDSSSWPVTLSALPYEWLLLPPVIAAGAVTCS